jgi:dihydrofolate reductase
MLGSTAPTDCRREPRVHYWYSAYARCDYEIFAAHWPYAEGGNDDFIAKRFNSVTKYVATRSTIELTWKGSIALRDAAADVDRLKREDGPALLTQGSSNLIQTLLTTDLIDEINTFTFPRSCWATARSCSARV